MFTPVSDVFCLVFLFAEDGTQLGVFHHVGLVCIVFINGQNNQGNA